MHCANGTRTTRSRGFWQSLQYCPTARLHRRESINRTRQRVSGNRPHDVRIRGAFTSARRFARQLNGRFRLPVHEVDERYTSVEAAQMRAEDLDSMAACLILERYFQQLHDHEKRST